MKIGDKVTTPDGEGVIVDVEVYSRQGNRYGVKLDSYVRWTAIDGEERGPMYYWEREIKKV